MGALMSPAEIASRREQMRQRLLKLRHPEAYRAEVLSPRRRTTLMPRGGPIPAGYQAGLARTRR